MTKPIIKYHEARQLLIDFINSAWWPYQPEATWDGANITIKFRGVIFVFFLDGPGCFGEDLDYLDHIETATGAGDFDDWIDTNPGHMNPIDNLPEGDRYQLIAIIDALMKPILERR
jgi:hypothetical protein